MNKFNIQEWWKANREKYYVERESFTLLHLIGFVVHFCAKFTSLIPTFSKKIYPRAAFLQLELRVALEKKVVLYLEKTKLHEDEHGFILHEHCDSTLMSGLYSTCGGKVNLEAARDKKGFWHRRPTDRPCYPNGSASTISRDMMLGVYWYLWEHDKVELAEKTYVHAKKHSFVMGKGDISRLLMMPGGEATLAEISHKFGGKDRWFARNQLQLWPKGLESYHVHLLMLHALLHAKVLGHSDTKMREAFEHYAGRNPNNPLHQFAYHLYTDGNMNKTVSLLLDERWWPNDRLPRRKDRKNDWITSRDFDDNWQPATDGDLEKEHPGGDFLFVAKLVLSALD